MTLNDLEWPFYVKLFCAAMFRALKHGFRSLATLKLVVNVVGEIKPRRTAAASRGFLATARLSCPVSCKKYATHRNVLQRNKRRCGSVENGLKAFGSLATIVYSTDEMDDFATLCSTPDKQLFNRILNHPNMFYTRSSRLLVPPNTIFVIDHITGYFVNVLTD